MELSNMFDGSLSSAPVGSTDDKWGGDKKQKTHKTKPPRIQCQTQGQR